MNLHSPKPNYKNEIKISGWFYIHTAILENSVTIRPPRKFVISQDIYNKSSATNHLSYRTATIQRQHFPSLFSLLKRPYHGHNSTENTKLSQNRRCHCFQKTTAAQGICQRSTFKLTLKFMHPGNKDATDNGDNRACRDYNTLTIFLTKNNRQAKYSLDIW